MRHTDSKESLENQATILFSWVINCVSLVDFNSWTFISEVKWGRNTYPYRAKDISEAWQLASRNRNTPLQLRLQLWLLRSVCAHSSLHLPLVHFPTQLARTSELSTRVKSSTRYSISDFSWVELSNHFNVRNILKDLNRFGRSESDLAVFYQGQGLQT